MQPTKQNHIFLKSLIIVLVICFSIVLIDSLIIDRVEAETVTLDDPLDPNKKYEGLELIKYIIVNIIDWVRTIAIMLAVLMFIVGGFIYMTSAGSDRVQTASKMLTGAAIGLLVVFTAGSIIIEVLWAIGQDPGEATGVLGGVLEGEGGRSSFTEIVGRVATVIAGFIISLGVLMLVVGGIMYMTAAGEDSRADMAKSIIKYAIMGITIALLAWSIVSFFATVFT